MLNKILIKRFIILMVAGLFFSTSAVLAVDSANLIATVAGVPITKFEILREVNRLMPLNTSYHSGITNEKYQELGDEALETLIERARKFRYAIDNEIAIEQDKYLAAQKKIRGNKTEKEFAKALGQESVTDFKASLYRKMTAEKAEQVVVDNNVSVSDDEVKAHYEANKTSYIMPQRFRASHILIKIDPSSNAKELEAIKAKAEALLLRARSGEDFYDLAYYNSEDRSKYIGGDIGYFHEGRTVKEFEQAVMSLKVGEISGLVRSRYGYHIIKLTELKEAGQLSYEEMETKIRNRLKKKQREELYRNWKETILDRYELKMLVGENADSKK